ncbi:hypothetical protein BDZ91DRAFT_783079 [Kalaharituber pfeilii]|nr:hypothetical protein BDZ91DRAFT_783079 [Kalaharituber pfeilii]
MSMHLNYPRVKMAEAARKRGRDGLGIARERVGGRSGVEGGWGCTQQRRHKKAGGLRTRAHTWSREVPAARLRPARGTQRAPPSVEYSIVWSEAKMHERAAARFDHPSQSRAASPCPRRGRVRRPSSYARCFSCSTYRSWDGVTD